MAESVINGGVAHPDRSEANTHNPIPTDFNAPDNKRLHGTSIQQTNVQKKSTNQESMLMVGVPGVGVSLLSIFPGIPEETRLPLLVTGILLLAITAYLYLAALKK